MALSLQTKVDIRRHLDVPAAGYPISAIVGGIRTVQASGQLETYMNALQAEEECVITGFPYAQVRIFGLPQIGSSVTVTVNGTPITYTAQASDFGPNNSPLYYSPIPPLQSIAFNLANRINASNVGPLAAGGMNYGAVPPVTLPDGSQVTITNPTTFTVSASGSGITAVVVANGSTYPSPQMQAVLPDGTQTVLYGFVPICNYLEGQVYAPSLSLQFQVTDVVTFRPDEVAARLQSYKLACMRLGKFLSVGMEAGLGARRIGTNSALRIVV